MRVKESIKKSGEFWLPHDEENKIHGTLLIEEGGKITLEIIGISSGLGDAVNSFRENKDKIDRINGQVEGFGNVSLEHCLYLGGSYSEISRSRYYVHMAVFGVAFDENEPILINEFKFSVEGIDEWVSINGFNLSYCEEERKAAFLYEPPEDLLIKINNGMTLIISTDWTIPSIGKSSVEARFNEKKYCTIESKTALPLDDFVSVAKKMTLFFCFAVDRTVCVDESVKIYSDSVFRNRRDGEKSLVEMTLYYRSVPYSDSVPNVLWFRMFFDYKSIQDVVDSTVNNWLDTYDAIEPALNLYFSAREGNKYLNSMFLSLVQGLETYHRRMSDDCVMDDGEFETLRNDLINACPERNRKWLEGRLKYGNEVNLSHYDKILEKSAARSNQLLLLCNKMEAIFQLHLLQRLGFSEDYIKSLINKPECDLKRKIECG